MLNESLCHLRAALSSLFVDAVVPEISVSWSISDKAISEIGGRLLEDFVVTQLPGIAQGLKLNVSCSVPLNGRNIEDIEWNWRKRDSEISLLVDVKSLNLLKNGSRPNLASIRKCIELFSSSSCAHQEPVIFLCRYRPETEKRKHETKVHFFVDSRSFTESGIFPLRWLTRHNLDPANIGSGGQLLLARENDIQLKKQSRQEFLSILRDMRSRLASHRKLS